MGEELADELRLRHGRRDRGADAVAAARPADLADHDAFPGKRASQLVVARERVVDRMLRRPALPVRQQVDRDEVDLPRELRMAKPDVPRLGGRDWQAKLLLDALQLLDELGHLQIAAQDRFVPDDHSIDVAVRARLAYERGELELVVRCVPIEPRPGGDSQPALAGTPRPGAVLRRRPPPDRGAALGPA